jgi:hypothetical protein
VAPVMTRAEMERLFELVEDMDTELGRLVRMLLGEVIVSAALHGEPLFDEPEPVYQ